MNWIESEAQKQNCDHIVCLGDYFDKSELNSEEVTALQEINWSNLEHWFIVGNHEMGRSNLEHSSSHLFQLLPNANVIDYIFVSSEGDTSIVMLPYILENNRTSLKEYLEPYRNQLAENIIILSHNDIAGIQMGNFLSTTGFTIEEIEENCNLFINGHLHNESDIGTKIINLGNITGQNFSEDAFRYSHKAAILDTVEKSLIYIENPYAMNFYKVTLNHMDALQDEKLIKATLAVLKYPAVATIRIDAKQGDIVKNILATCDNIIEHRIIVDGVAENKSITITNEVTLDHIQKFQMYVMENIGKDELTLNELERVSK